VLGYNGRRYIDDCLGSVLDQDAVPCSYEVLFADNASSDGSAEYVRAAFPSVRVLEFAENHGFAEGNNRAARFARGDYIAFLNQDTVVHKRWLSELLGALRSDPALAACYSNSVMPWCAEYGAKQREGPIDHAYVADLSRYGFVEYVRVPFASQPIETLFLSGASMVIDRTVADRLGYIFDRVFFAYCEDMDLGLRLNSLGYKTALMPASIVYHEQTRPSLLDVRELGKLSRIIRNRFLAYYKNLSAGELLLFLPLLLLGAPRKASVFGFSFPKRLLMGAGLIPVSLWSLAAALVALPRCARQRRQILSQRQREGYWFLVKLVRGMAWRASVGHRG
jgi:GT2 family glycosyltransferase